MFRIGKSIRIERKLVVSKGLGPVGVWVGRLEVMAKAYLLLGVIKMF